MPRSKPEEPWFATGVGVALAGLGAIAVQWQTYATAPLENNVAFWGWLSYLSIALILTGSLVALSSAGLVLPKPWAPPLRLARRVRTRLVSLPPEPEPDPPAPVWQLPLPYIDSSTGQMVMRMRHRDTTDTEIKTPHWPASVHVTGPGIDGEAVTGLIHNDHVLWKYINVEFPRHFRNAPDGPIRPGRYEAVWRVHPATYDAESGTFVAADGGEFGRRTWTVREGGRTWL